MTHTTLPKSDSQGSINSEYFGHGSEYFDYDEIEIAYEISEDGDKEPGTPEPPNMRRNGGSFGSFGSLSAAAAHV
jgi:hypothetical protein